MMTSSRFVVRVTIVLYAVGLLMLLGIVDMSIWLNARARMYLDDVIEARDTHTSAVELRSVLQTAGFDQRSYLVTGDGTYLASYESAKAESRRQLDALKPLLAPHAGTQVMLDRLSAVTVERIAEMDRSIALKSDGRDDEAMALVHLNHDKELTDKTNVVLAAIIRTADERMTMSVGEQRANAAVVRWITITGTLMIVLVAGGVIVTFTRYARELARARDEVRLLAAGLEERVQARTADLAQARDRAEVLLTEVNHRVANSLSLVASLVRLQGNVLKDPAARAALNETRARIVAIADVHARLYSSGDVRFLALDEYLSGLLEKLATSMLGKGHNATVRSDLAPLKVRIDSAVNLGVVVVEWVTNAFKYAYPDGNGEVRVRLKTLPDGHAELTVEDDGIGRMSDAPIQGTGVGTRLVTAMARSLRAEVHYLARTPGTAACLMFPLPPAE